MLSRQFCSGGPRGHVGFSTTSLPKLPLSSGLSLPLDCAEMWTALPKELELELEASLGLGLVSWATSLNSGIEVGVILTCARGRGVDLHLKIVLQLRGNRILLTGVLGTERDRGKKTLGAQ